MEMEQKLVQYNEKLHKLASLDPLTGLLNRRSMREYLEKRIKAYNDGHVESMALAIGDIDYFKKINDTYGHECGDIVLKKAGCFVYGMYGRERMCQPVGRGRVSSGVPPYERRRSSYRTKRFEPEDEKAASGI